MLAESSLQAYRTGTRTCALEDPVNRFELGHGHTSSVSQKHTEKNRYHPHAPR